MRENESRFIKCDEPARGASGDIGFTLKASNINGLRAVKQQYLPLKTEYHIWALRAFQRIECPFFY